MNVFNLSLKEIKSIATSSLFDEYFEKTYQMPTESYFNGDKLAIDVFNAKYALTLPNGKKETPGECFWRLMTELDKIEEYLGTSKKKRKYFKRMGYILLFEGWFRPGGSIISGLWPDAGKRKISLFNCTTIPLLEDSLEGIFKCAYEIAKCGAFRQGIGCDVSVLRPTDTPIANAAEISDGPVHWMDFIQQIGNYVGQKGRVLALLLSLKVSHPNIEQFLIAKSDLNKIPNANISVQIGDDFMEAVKKNLDYTLSFYVPEHDVKVEKTVNARKLFYKLAEQAVKYAEPGIQFSDSLFKNKMGYFIGKYLNKPEYMPISTNASFHEDTLVVTKNGLVKIKELVGKEVEVWDGEQWVKINNFRVTGRNRKLLRITFVDGNYVDATPDHTFVLANDVEILAGNLKPGMKLKLTNPPINSAFNLADPTIINIEPLPGVYTVYCCTVPTNHRFTILGNLLTGQCSEAPLAPYSVCNLLSINMAKFSPNPKKYILQLAEIVPIIVRILDDCIHYELYYDLSPLPQQKEIVSKLKEIGCGITNLHLWFLNQGIDYDSDEAIEKIDEFMSHYTKQVIRESAFLGKERGKAPILQEISFNDFRNAIKDWQLYQNLKDKFPEVAWAELLYNCANTSFMSIAPTGSISLIFPEPCFSAGVEPVIGWWYWRKTRAVNKGKYIYYFVIPNPVKKFILEKIPRDSEDYEILSSFPGSVRDDDGKVGEKYVKIIQKYIGKDTCKPAHLIDPFKKVELMGGIYKWMDGSISCTYNLAEDADTDLVFDLFLKAHETGVRSITVYREGSRDGVLIFDPPPIYERKFALKQKLCIDRPANIEYHCAPSRPQELPCDIHHVTVKGQPWLVLVGILDGAPYEIFAGKYDPDVMYVPKTQTEGVLRKCGKGKYNLIVRVRNSEIEYKDIARLFMNEENRALTRLVSLSLRHGVPIEFIVSQLKKSAKDITEFSMAVARVLSKYAAFSTLTQEEKCPNCGQGLVRKAGCLICDECGYSKCE